MVRVTGTGKFTKAVSKKLHVAEDEVEDEADSDKEKEEAKEEVVDDVKENADDAGGSDGDEEADDEDDEKDDEDEDEEDEDEEDGLGDSEEEEEEEEEGAVKKGKSRKRNQFIDDAAEVRPLPEPMRVIALVAVCFTRRVHIIAAQTAREDLRTSEIGPASPIAFSRIF